MPNEIIGEITTSGEIIGEISGMTYQSVADQITALDTAKADKATTYTKTEVDTKDDALVAQLNDIEQDFNAQLAEKVKSVNDVLPDVNGNVEIEAGGLPPKEDWINATLINGASGYLKYRKNQVGQLEIDYALSDLVGVNVDLCFLSARYRPSATIDLATHSNSAFGIFRILSSGGVRRLTGSGVYMKHQHVVFID